MSPTTWRAHRPQFARPAFRTLSLIASLGASSALAGCGSGPTPPAIARADAAPLVRLASRVAEEAPCAQRRDIRQLETRAGELVRTGRVPAALERPLLAGVSALAADSPPCLSAVPAAVTTPPPAVTQPAQPARPERHHPEHPPGHEHGPRPDHGDDHHHGHGHGKGKR